MYDVSQGCIVEERVHLLRTDDEYMPKYGCRNFVENKIRVGGISFNKTCAQKFTLNCPAGNIV